MRIGLKLSHCYHAWVHQNSEKKRRKINDREAEKSKLFFRGKLNSFFFLPSARVFLETEKPPPRVKSFSLCCYFFFFFFEDTTLWKKQWSISCHNVINDCMNLHFHTALRIKGVTSLIQFHLNLKFLFFEFFSFFLMEKSQFPQWLPKGVSFSKF